MKYWLTFNVELQVGERSFSLFQYFHVNTKSTLFFRYMCMSAVSFYNNLMVRYLWCRHFDFQIFKRVKKMGCCGVASLVNISMKFLINWFRTTMLWLVIKTNRQKHLFLSAFTSVFKVISKKERILAVEFQI